MQEISLHPNNWSCTCSTGNVGAIHWLQILASEYAKNHFGWIQMTWMWTLTKQNVFVRADPIARCLFDG
jgi:hypothetical protein